MGGGGRGSGGIDSFSLACLISSTFEGGALTERGLISEGGILNLAKVTASILHKH